MNSSKYGMQVPRPKLGNLDVEHSASESLWQQGYEQSQSLNSTWVFSASREIMLLSLLFEEEGAEVLESSCSLHAGSLPIVALATKEEWSLGRDLPRTP